MDSPAVDRIGQLIAGRYKITGALGEGVMAMVYRAEDQHLDNLPVAIKILRDTGEQRSAYRSRWDRALLVANKLNHPSCLRIFDVGSCEDGLPFQVMELVSGTSLVDLLDDEVTLPPSRALPIFRQLLEALVECEKAGVIHRDIKPENILLCGQQGERNIKLIDFGIAKLIGEAAVGQAKLTSVGLVLGTPHYIAPEWVKTDKVDCRADLYSASILLFEMLTSTPPFLSDDSGELIRMHLKDEVPRLIERSPHGDFSEELEALVQKGLAKEPDERFSSANEYLSALAPLIAANSPSDPIQVDPPEPAAVAPAAASKSAPTAKAPPPEGEAAKTSSRVVTSIVPPPSNDHFPIKWIAAVVLLVGILAVAIIITTGQNDPVVKALPATGTTAVQQTDAGTPPPSNPDSDSTADTNTPPPSNPIDDAAVARVTSAFAAAGLPFSGFIAIRAAQGACRLGRVASVRVYLCRADGDPFRSDKTVRKMAPGDKSPRKWRAVLVNGDLHLRVEDTKSKKKKKARRKIETVFSEMK